MVEMREQQINVAGPLGSFAEREYGLTIESECANFDVVFYTDSIIRIHRHHKEEDMNPYSVIQSPTFKDFKWEERDDSLLITSRHFDVKIHKNPLIFTFLTKEGQVINRDDPGLGIQNQGDHIAVYKELQEGEKFVGLGEKTGPLNRRGHGYQNWNTDLFAYGLESDPIYSSIPFYIGIHQQLSYGIFLDNSYKTHFNFGASNRRFSSFTMDAGDLDYYYLHGSVTDIIRSYTWLTGRMELPPLWSIGYQQCRYSYYPEREVLDVAKKFRTKRIPADVLVLDIHHMDSYKIFSWDSKCFPNPKKMQEQLKTMGFETTVICNPGIKKEEGYAPYHSGIDRDIFVRYPDGSYYEGEAWPGWCCFPDFTKEEGRTWWQEMMTSYADVGVKGFWNDMNEIATWGQMMPENIWFSMEGEGATSRKARNIYGLQMTKASLEGAKVNLKGERPFILTRSGFSGVQRYSGLWTGDNVATNDHMLLGVRLVNSLGLSGVSFAGYDVGGFTGNGESRLFARWIQLGAFSPFFRGHTMINSKSAEPWTFGEEVEQVATNYIRLRYRLIPYLYQAFHESSQTGMPVARSLAINYTHDDMIYDPMFENQYLYGDSIMVAPIRSDQCYVKIYLPKGDWYEFFTDEKREGNQQIICEYALEHLPLFVRASSIIPLYPKVGMNTKELGDTLELHIYNGTEARSSQYYEDDGTSYKYVDHQYHRRCIQFDPIARTLSIGKVMGTYKSRMKHLRIVFHGFASSLLDNIPSTYSDTYSFVAPMSHFDPFTAEKPHKLKIESVMSLDIAYPEDEWMTTW